MSWELISIGTSCALLFKLLISSLEPFMNLYSGPSIPCFLYHFVTTYGLHVRFNNTSTRREIASTAIETKTKLMKPSISWFGSQFCNERGNLSWVYIGRFEKMERGKIFSLVEEGHYFLRLCELWRVLLSFPLWLFLFLGFASLRSKLSVSSLKYYLKNYRCILYFMFLFRY